MINFYVESYIESFIGGRGGVYWKRDVAVTFSTEADHIPSNFLKSVFHKFYLFHSWILCPKYEITKQTKKKKL